MDSFMADLHLKNFVLVLWEGWETPKNIADALDRLLP